MAAIERSETEGERDQRCFQGTREFLVQSGRLRRMVTENVEFLVTERSGAMARRALMETLQDTPRQRHPDSSALYR
jgi:hypothetical protein